MTDFEEKYDMVASLTLNKEPSSGGIAFYPCTKKMKKEVPQHESFVAMPENVAKNKDFVIVKDGEKQEAEYPEMVISMEKDDPYYTVATIYGEFEKGDKINIYWNKKESDEK